MRSCGGRAGPGGGARPCRWGSTRWSPWRGSAAWRSRSRTFGASLDGTVFETVLIARDGAAERLTLFDFDAPPEGRPRARRFDVPDLDCVSLGQVILDGASTCEGAGLDG